MSLQLQSPPEHDENAEEDDGNDNDDVEIGDEFIGDQEEQEEREDDLECNSMNEEPLAEGDESLADNNNDNDNNTTSTLIVSEEMCNSMKFYTLCNALETIWKNPKWSDVQKLWKLLPPKFLQHLQQEQQQHDTSSSSDSKKRQRVVQSIFPIFRLLMPEKDGTRQFQMAESTISILYGNALGLSKQSSKYNMLLYYTDPNYVINKAQGLGDLSIVVQTVVGSTKVASMPSSYTVGQINHAFDILASLPSKARQNKSNHDWKNNLTKDSTTVSSTPTKRSKGKDNKSSKTLSLKDLRVKWLQQLNDGYNFTSTTNTLNDYDHLVSSSTTNIINHGLSPLEHKWLVRILLKKMQFGLGWKKLLQWYNPYAAMLWSAHNSLKGICNKICDPEFTKAREITMQQQQSSDGQASSSNSNNNEPIGLSSYMPRSLVAPQFGIVFSPMLSERTGFGRILNDISYRHRDYIQSDDARTQYPNVPSDCLAFLHPTFCVEPKLDGERFLVHVSRDGVVKMHTRRGNWYSELYSPVLGPSIRRAVRKGLDVILDGEVIAWDSVRKETVPFGSNRTIAKLRTDYMAKNGMLDPRDRDMHAGDTSNKSMNASNSFLDKPNSAGDIDTGNECWLQFILFDLIYIHGPDAKDILSQTVSEHIVPPPEPGSIIHLEASERKNLLYKIIDPQLEEVEIVTTWIIRSNGRTDKGETYFHPINPTMENGFIARKLDSLSFNLSGMITDISRIDAQRRFERSDEQISQNRAQAIQSIYDFIVEEQMLEGLVFKDLSTPYFLGEESKATRYWHKFKPDYFNGSAASDLDVVVIGAYYATGLRNSGKPSTLLCACVDSEDSEAFLPVVKVNFNSIDAAQVSEILKATGYRNNESSENNSDEDDDANYIENKWQKSDWNTKYYPEFISNKSFQPNNENNGWRAQKKDYPDLWIHPRDSVVVTLNAGEIVVSDAFSAGITLRFPRITKVRQGADGKEASDIESEESLREKYWDVQNSRSNSSGGLSSVTLGSPACGGKVTPCRFLTETQYRESFRKRRAVSRRGKQVKAVAVPEAEVISTILKGISVAVLGGSGYTIVNGTIEYDEAKEEGWNTDLNQFTDVKSFIKFIKKHSAKYKISVDHDCKFVIGGSIHDSKVVTYIRSIEHARLQLATFSHKITSKKGQDMASIARSDGVLRWTFLVSLVSRWIAQGHSVQDAIVETDPDFLKPTLLDYLVRPKPPIQDGVLEPKIDVSLYDTDLSTITKMRRALDIVSSSKKFSEQDSLIAAWSSTCMKKLNPPDRWIAACNLQVLWPYCRDPMAESHAVVIYPDIFYECDNITSQFGFVMDSDITPEHVKYRWSENLACDLHSEWIQSVLPLLRVMGAYIATDLHIGVTHVLCDIKDYEIEYSSQVDESVFLNHRRGLHVLERLQELFRNGTTNILLVSPDWVRKRKWLQSSSSIYS